MTRGKNRIFYDISNDYPIVSVVGLGPQDAGYDQLEEVDQKLENIRAAISAGARAVRCLGAELDELVVDGCGEPKAAAEGGILGLYVFDELKSEKYRTKPLRLTYANADSAQELNEWNRGVTLANGQNITRRLMEMPANLMTPTIFAKTVADMAVPLGVKVIAHDRKWAEEQKMFSFLSVTNGSEQPPVFLEMHYNKAPDTQPLALVGKGICFDSGGISLKPSSNMDKMRADMGGAANVVAAIITLASMEAKVNVIGALTVNVVQLLC